MIVFRLPSLGADMDKGTLLEWRVRPGDAVKKGDLVAVVDTTKAAIDVECWQDGTVEALLVEPGVEVPVGTAMAVLREAGETAEQVRAQVEALRAAPRAQATEPAAPALESRGAPITAEGGRVQASPAARKRAAELGIGLVGLTGTGAGGAITLADVEAAAAGGRRRRGPGARRCGERSPPRCRAASARSRTITSRKTSRWQRRRPGLRSATRPAT
jgi:pyruvate dehydrogenase E2 component (dihydrolipoamide acetyltransferase)